MFTGFTDKTLDFLIAIRYNNNRAFFHENHDWYMDSVRKPLLDLAYELGGTIEGIDPELERRPERVVSRISRDLRFSKDKSPYRDYMWIGFYKPSNRHGFPGFYVDISADHLGYGFGFWEDNKPLLNAHRLLLQNHPERFLNMIGPATEGMGVEVRSYKKLALPEDLLPEAKIWYPMRTIHVFGTVSDTKRMLSPGIVDFIKREYQKLAPIYGYFAGLKPVEI